MNKHKNAGFIRVSLLTKTDIDNTMVNEMVNRMAEDI